MRLMSFFLFFFFNDTATTEIYTLSLHDALPICPDRLACSPAPGCAPRWRGCPRPRAPVRPDGRGRSRRRRTGSGCGRSEEHTSELQSHSDLVCRLLLEKKKKENDDNRCPHTYVI